MQRRLNKILSMLFFPILQINNVLVKEISDWLNSVAHIVHYSEVN